MIESCCRSRIEYEGLYEPGSQRDEEEHIISHKGEEQHVSSQRSSRAKRRKSIKSIPNDRPVRIYCDGIYDLFHYGHARSLEQAKKLFPSVHLIVGVCNDKDTQERKGKTVMNEVERAESLRHCKWVDDVIENAPWVVTDEYLEEHKIDFIAHDDIPYVYNGVDLYQHWKDEGKFISTRRTAAISTSDLITRIVRDYDIFIRRNLARGVKRADMNVSLLKEGEIKFKDGIESAKRVLNWIETESGEIIKEFVRLFDGSVKRMWKAVRGRGSSNDSTAIEDDNSEDFDCCEDEEVEEKANE